MSNVDIHTAKQIMGMNFLGPDELCKINSISFSLNDRIDDVPFSKDELCKKKDEYLLIWGSDYFADGSPVTIRKFISLCGKDPDVSEPCFYNQDWYDKEDFLDLPMKRGWYFIRKNVYEDSRGVLPDDLMIKYGFPSAISCVYSFLVVWLALGIKLWYHDFIWCSDTDHNGDRIYVGKYHDVDGVNKNGFSIHRHLSLRSCYACID